MEEEVEKDERRRRLLESRVEIYNRFSVKYIVMTNT